MNYKVKGDLFFCSQLIKISEAR